MKTIAMLVALLITLIIPSMAAAQTDPCSSSATTTVLSPSSIYAVLPDFNGTVDGTASPLYTEIIVGIFNTGVNPATGAPVQTLTVPKANATVVNATTGCYKLTPTTILSLPLNVQQFGAAKVRRTTPDVAESDWSPLSNPFVRPAALSAPSAVRFTR